MGQVPPSLGGGPHVNLVPHPPQLTHTLQPVEEAGLVTDHSAAFPHQVAEVPLQGAGQLGAGVDERVELFVGRADDRSGPQSDIGRRRDGGRGRPRPPPVDDGLHERVAAEPVGTVQAAGALSGGEEPHHVRGMGLGVGHVPPIE